MKRTESNDDGCSSTARNVSRRQLLATGAAASTFAAAGCSDVVGLLSPSLPSCEDAGEQREPEGPARIGSETADVRIEVFEDFACGHCAEFNETVAPAIKAEYVEPGDVRYVHRDFPIPVDQWSWKAANAAREVQSAAGNDAFFEYAASVFENHGEYSESLLVSLAGDVGVDESSVERAIEDRSYCELLRTEREAGTDRGIEGTPTVAFEDELLTAPSESELREAIESRLDQ